MDDSAPPQASTVQLTPYSLPLRLSSRLLQSHRIHTPTLCEKFSKRRFAVFERFTSRKLSRQMQDFKNETRGALLRQKATLPQPAEFYNKNSTTSREARLAAPNRTAVPLPEIHGIFRSRTISVLSLKFPCHPLLKSCICLRGLPTG